MADRHPRRKNLRRKLAGYAWTAGWMAALYAVAAPWRKLGGLESETLRWLEWVVLFGGLSLGFTVGRFARDAAEADPRRTHAGLLRVLLYPPAVLTAGALVAWSFVSERGPIGVAFTAFLAYWAGLDLAFGALPLMEGKAYAFRRPIDDGRE